MKLSRRSVLAGSTLAASAMAAPALAKTARGSSSPAARFSMKYAPHDGSFRSRGTILDQIAYAADQGFTAWEDNGLRDRSIADQEAMARLFAKYDMTMGVFVANNLNWNGSTILGGADDALRQAFLEDIRASVEVAKRINAKWMTVVPGFLDKKLPLTIQTGRIIEVLRRAAAIFEPHGLVMVLEPLNTLTDHPGVLLQTIPQGYEMCKAVGSPAVKILADLYHAQIQTGNLIPTLDVCWDEVGYIQIGDNPGRNEPGSGEVNYHNIFRWLRARGYTGVLGMEHGNSLDGRPGEDRLIAAYREADLP